jgi:hypothetical protein
MCPPDSKTHVINHFAVLTVPIARALWLQAVQGIAGLDMQLVYTVPVAPCPPCSGNMVCAVVPLALDNGRYVIPVLGAVRMQERRALSRFNLLPGLIRCQVVLPQCLQPFAAILTACRLSFG